jgi:peptidoglycan/LPS O-acetylase OafA/YrhL
LLRIANPWAMIATSSVATVLIAAIPLHLFIERPARRALRRFD